MTKPETTPEPIAAPPSNFASRRAAREAAEAAGEAPRKWQSPTLRAQTGSGAVADIATPLVVE